MTRRSSTYLIPADPKIQLPRYLYEALAAQAKRDRCSVPATVANILDTVLKISDPRLPKELKEPKEV